MKRTGAVLAVVGVVLVLGWSVVLFAQAAPAKEEAAKTAKPSKAVTGLWDLYVASGFEGVLITLCSIWMIAVILHNFFTLRHKVLIPTELVEQTDNLLRQKQAKAALELCQQSDSLLGVMMAAGISRVGRGYDTALEYMGDIGQEKAMRLNHKLSYLSIIGSISPMLGLLGTVRGMIQAFAQIASSGAQPSPADLSNNIQLALVTTFEGLVVAIPSLFFYSLFKNHLARAVTECEMICLELMSRFQGVTTPLTRVGMVVGPAAPPPAAAPPGDKTAT
jgi:biopolymer transport protein ExbB